MAEKLFYSMGELAEMFDVKTSLIRHWESQFSILKPKRNKKGNRLFSPQDVENLKVIYHLVKERGMTLEGARRAMKRQAAGGVGMERDAELMTRLKHIRALLVEVREDLKTGGEGIVADEDSGFDEPVAESAPRRGKKAVVKFEPEAALPAGEEAPVSVEESVAAVEKTPVSVEEPAAAVEETSASVETSVVAEEEAPVSAADTAQPAAETPQPAPRAPKSRSTASRRPRRKSDDDDDKELFAFYEQSLF